MILGWVRLLLHKAAEEQVEIDFLEFSGALVPGWQEISDEHLLMAFEKWKTGTDL